MDPVLQTEKLCKSFGALTVAQDIDFRLHAGDRHALIGPNGAGKTTFVNMLMGALEPISGRIRLGGEDVTRVRQAQRVKRGLGRTFQINALFNHLPVLDNVASASPSGATRRTTCGARLSSQGDPAGKRGVALYAGSGRRRPRSGEGPALRQAAPGGDRDRPRPQPKVLLLDEPAAGVPSTESERILQVLDRLPAAIAILIIEHDMDLVFRFARRITVLVQGEVLVEGPPEEVRRDRRVHEVYLGEQHHA